MRMCLSSTLGIAECMHTAWSTVASVRDGWCVRRVVCWRVGLHGSVPRNVKKTERQQCLGLYKLNPNPYMNWSDHYLYMLFRINMKIIIFGRCDLFKCLGVWSQGPVCAQFCQA